MNSLVALLRERSMEKIALPINPAAITNAIGKTGMHATGTLAGSALGSIYGAYKGYKNAEKGEKLKGALIGGTTGAVGGGIIGSGVGSGITNLKGIGKQVSQARQAYNQSYKAQHSMSMPQRLKSMFSEQGRKELSRANKAFAREKSVKGALLDKHKESLSSNIAKIQTSPTMSYNQQVSALDTLHSKTPLGQLQVAKDKRLSGIVAPVAGLMTGASIIGAGNSALQQPDEVAAAQGIMAKKKMTDYDKFLLDQKMGNIMRAQGTPTQAPMSQPQQAQPQSSAV